MLSSFLAWKFLSQQKLRGKLAPALRLPAGAHNADMDKARRLYLIAYDVCSPQRLQSVCRYLSGFRVGGQKSVFELWLTTAELQAVRQQLAALMNSEEDRLHVLALDPRQKPRCYGRASSFIDQHFAIV